MYSLPWFTFQEKKYHEADFAYYTPLSLLVFEELIGLKK